MQYDVHQISDDLVQALFMLGDLQGDDIKQVSSSFYFLYEFLREGIKQGTNQIKDKADAFELGLQKGYANAEEDFAEEMERLRKENKRLKKSK
ncbi:MAG: hypothetical protein JXL97_08650 [Bacteroidales bacterium]|nr:hypothetical protein [Bacteroidales bacterium]